MLNYSISELRRLNKVIVADANNQIINIPIFKAKIQNNYNIFCNIHPKHSKNNYIYCEQINI